MRSVEVLRRKQRLDLLFRKISSFTDDPELQSDWARYLCVLVSGFIEVSVSIILTEYAQNKSAPTVMSFVSSRLKDYHNLNMERLLTLVGIFNPDWREKLKLETEGVLKDSIDSIVANRNKIAHGENVGVTYIRMKEWYDSVIKVLELLERQCAS